MKRILSKADKKLAKDEARIKNLEKLFVEKRAAMLASRLESLPMCLANRYCIINDEIRLRQEIEFGHNVDRRDRITGRAILTEATANGHFNIVRMLIHEYDVDISVRTLLGQQTALHIACEKGHRQIASLLITYGADVNAVDQKGRTPLHMVRFIVMAKLLHKFEVDPLAKTYDEHRLKPSEYYVKVVPKAEQSLELFNYLATRENKAEGERNRARHANARLLKSENEKALKEKQFRQRILELCSNKADIESNI